jgi:hypothetical protein
MLDQTTIARIEFYMEGMMAPLKSQIAELTSKIDELECDNQEFRRRLGVHNLTEHGMIPALTDITYMKSQIWYTPNLSQEDRRNKSIWSLRISFDICHRRAMQEINIRLFPFKQFYKLVKQPKYQVPAIMQCCEFLRQQNATDATWAGLVQSFTRGAGRPYEAGQAALLMDHEIEITPNSPHTRLHLIVEGKPITFGHPRPAAGGDRSALWFVEWRPNKP